MSSVIKKSVIDDIPEEVYQELDHLGIQNHLLGYDYIAYAIYMNLNDVHAVNSMTKVVYPEIAKVFETTPSRVERAIRSAIEKLFDTGNYSIIYSYFNNTIDTEKCKATNTQFIATLSRVVRKKLLQKDQLSETEVS